MFIRFALFCFVVLEAHAQAPFVPPNGPDQGFTFVVYGDIQQNVGGAHQKLIPLILAEKPAFVLHSGDISEDRGEGYETGFLPIARPLLETTPFLPSAGNHDVDFGSDESRLNFSRFFRAAFDWLEGMPQNAHLREQPRQKLWYSFTFGGLAFICLDSNLLIDEGKYRATNQMATFSGYRDEQMRWLEKELQRINGDPAIRGGFVFMHHSTVYSVENKRKLGLFGGHPGHRRMMLTQPMPTGNPIPLMVDALRSSKLQGVFSGHVHFYERWSDHLTMGSRARQFSWLVVGNGGARPRANALSAPDEISKLLSEGDLYAYQQRCLPSESTGDPPGCWTSELVHQFPTPETPESRFFGFTVVRVSRDEITFETKDTDGRVRDSGSLKSVETLIEPGDTNRSR